MITRRRFLWCAGASAGAMLVAPQLVFASAETDKRFVFVIQRGAADGLNIVVPYGDPAYASLRGTLAIDASTATKLDGTFALHPSLAQAAQMYRDKQALFVHAVASPYRERSHFDGQNVLETGDTAPYQMRDGWLNRLLSMLPTPRADAVAFAPTVPLALRGRAEVTSYAPSSLPQAPDDLITRVSQLYAGDAQLHPLWDAAMQARGLAADAGAVRIPRASASSRRAF